MKTVETDLDVNVFLDSLDNEKRKSDAYQLLSIMSKATNKEPKMWGSSIVGFGRYHYKYESGREGDWFMSGFSPRAQALTIYMMRGFGDYDAYLEKLGTFKTGKACLYIKKIEDIDTNVLFDFIKKMVEDISRGASVIG